MRSEESERGKARRDASSDERGRQSVGRRRFLSYSRALHDRNYAGGKTSRLSSSDLSLSLFPLFPSPFLSLQRFSLSLSLSLIHALPGRQETPRWRLTRWSRQTVVAVASRCRSQESAVAGEGSRDKACKRALACLFAQVSESRASYLNLGSFPRIPLKEAGARREGTHLSAGDAGRSAARAGQETLVQRQRSES